MKITRCLLRWLPGVIYWILPGRFVAHIFHAQAIQWLEIALKCRDQALRHAENSVDALSLAASWPEQPGNQFERTANIDTCHLTARRHQARADAVIQGADGLEKAARGLLEIVTKLKSPHGLAVRNKLLGEAARIVATNTERMRKANQVLYDASASLDEAQ